MKYAGRMEEKTILLSLQYYYINIINVATSANSDQIIFYFIAHVDNIMIIITGWGPDLNKLCKIDWVITIIIIIIIIIVVVLTNVALR